MFCTDCSSTSPEIIRAVQLISEDFPISAESELGRMKVEFRLSSTSPRFTYRDGKACISGKTLPQMLRSLASLRGFAESGSIPSEYIERTLFDTLGLMLDASRNAVPTLSMVKFLLRRMALMGMNVLMLYTEDTYEVPGQPFIGYLRGRYTQAELRELDDYAAALGIEMLPCIQTLGHLEQMLRWNVFNSVKDTEDILLVGEPETYRLLEQMISAASAPYRSRRIHIGMDEAHGLGLGRYKQLHGIRPRFDIMNEHLREVVSITNRLGLQPMIWSDMYFRLGSKSGGYYDANSQIPVGVAQEIPREVELVYWDYYHADKEFYAEWIDRHRALGKEPVFAGGLWAWGVFWQNFGKAKIATDAAMTACKEKGVRQALTTAWGDDGTEVDMLSMLPGLQHFAEHGYSEVVTDEVLNRQFYGSTGTDMDHWTIGRYLDEVPWQESIRESYDREGSTKIRPIGRSAEAIADLRQGNWSANNPSKFLLWQDPLLGLCDEQTRGFDLTGHYKQVSVRLRRAISTSTIEREHLHFALCLADVLQDKAELGGRLIQAYREDNRTALTNLHDRGLPRALRKLRRLHEEHRRLWFSLYKPNGWEVLDARYGTLESRLTSTRLRIGDYLNGDITNIPELDEERLPCLSCTEGRMPNGPGTYKRIVTPSTLV